MKAALAICGVAILGLGYNSYSTRAALEERINALEHASQKTENNVTKLQQDTTAMASDLGVVGKKLGVTAQELNASRKYAEKIRQEQEQAKEQLTTELAEKANATDVAAAAKETSSKLAEVQQDANSKIGTVSTRLDATNADLAASRREITDVRTTLSQQIARNSSELGDLRKKGERDFFEFDIKKDRKHPLARVADIQLELKDTNVKRQRYDVVIQVDDARLEKKDRTANEPVQFLVGRDKLRYEVVVNFVDKDRIRGYLSTPKDKVLSAERPAFRQPEK